MRFAVSTAASVVILVLGAGCGADAFRQTWTAFPEQAVIFSLTREEGNLASGFDMIQRDARRIEAPGNAEAWDFALDTQGGILVFLPPPLLGITNSNAGIAPFPGMEFDELLKAPRDDDLYISDQPIPVEFGTTYVVRTREDPTFSNCFFFGKFVVMESSVQDGTLRILFDTNPLCEDRDLVPPPDDN